MSACKILCRDLPFEIGTRLHDFATSRNPSSAFYELESVVRAVRRTVDDHVAAATVELEEDTTKITATFVHKNSSTWTKRFSLDIRTGTFSVEPV